MNKKIIIQEKHPLAIRWFHWINFPILFLMIVSGLEIYWGNDIYQIGIGDHVLFHFFPDWFYDFFGLKTLLADGISKHFFWVWIFTINGLCYFLYLLFSGEWRVVAPNRSTLKNALQITLYDFKLSKVKPHVEIYNGAQQIAYTAVILMGAGSLLTGLAIYKPVQASGLTQLLGGYEAARFEHFILTIGYILFFLVHIVQVIRSGWSNFSSMVTGFEKISADKTPVEGQNEKEN